MALQCGIIGITNVGKTTLFNCISNTKGETTQFAFSTNRSNVGLVTVPDPRLYELEKLQTTDRIVPATVDIVDIPGLTKGANQGEGVGNKFLGDIRNTDALIHVLRCFDDENLAHIDGSVDPVRDIETIDLELQVKDLESVEKKLERLEKLVKAGDKDAKTGIDAIMKVKDHLEGFNNVRSLELNDIERKHVSDLFLLTQKPVLFVCNVNEGSAVSGNAYVEKVKEALPEGNAEILVIAGKLEAEIAELDDPDDRKAFLEDAGLKEPGVNKLVRSAYNILDLQSFFIHSDLERGFIRAEVMKYDDFVTLGSENECRHKGKLYVEGKNYVVADGDILHIRFNV
jgi:GTP-binding protein YchF